MPEIQKTEEKKKFNWWNLVWVGLAAGLIADYLPDREFDLFDQNDPDIDNDGLSNHVEAMWGLDPTKPDSDGDNIIDSEEGIFYIATNEATGQQERRWLPTNVLPSMDNPEGLGDPYAIDALEKDVAVKHNPVVLPPNMMGQ